MSPHRLGNCWRQDLQHSHDEVSQLEDRTTCFYILCQMPKSSMIILTWFAGVACCGLILWWLPSPVSLEEARDVVLAAHAVELQEKAEIISKQGEAAGKAGHWTSIATQNCKRILHFLCTSRVFVAAAIGSQFWCSFYLHISANTQEPSNALCLTVEWFFLPTFSGKLFLLALKSSVSTVPQISQQNALEEILRCQNAMDHWKTEAEKLATDLAKQQQALFGWGAGRSSGEVFAGGGGDCLMHIGNMCKS